MSAILQEIPQSSVTEISLKITSLKFCLNLPGANELKSYTLPLLLLNAVYSIQYTRLSYRDTLPYLLYTSIWPPHT